MKDRNLNIINYAFKNIEFYKKYYSDFINTSNIDQNIFYSLPILNKKEVQNNYEKLLNHNYDNLPQKSFITSGTTGLPLKINWLNSQFIKSNFHTWYLRRKWYNILPEDTYCTFHSTVTSNQRTVIDDVILYENNRILSLGRYFYSEEKLSEYVNMIISFKPKWILAQPSVLYQIAIYLESHNLHIKSLKYIELNGEFVDPPIYYKIKKIFNVPVANLYGSIEFNGIGLTCPEGHMHILKNNVFLENNNSELIITGLNNYYMPLIRYNIGDIGSIMHNVNCSCGEICDELVLQKGRSHELIKLKSNYKIDPIVFTNIVNDLNVNKLVVLQFCLLVKKDTIILLLLVDKEHKRSIELKKNYYLNMLYTLNLHNIKFRIDITTDERVMLNENHKFTFIRYE